MKTKNYANEVKNEMGFSSRLAVDKPGGLGLFETISLRLKGRTDGKHHIFCNQNDEWTSPNLVQEIHRYEVEAEKMWGDLQACITELYVELSKTNRTIKELKKKVQDLSSQVATIDGIVAPVVRKAGEEDIPESIVADRRQREQFQANKHVYQQLQEARDQLAKCEIDATQLRDSILSNVKTAKYCSDMHASYMRERISCYWHSVYRYSMESDMPAEPTVYLCSDFETSFLERNRQILEDVSQQESDRLSEKSLAT